MNATTGAHRPVPVHQRAAATTTSATCRTPWKARPARVVDRGLARPHPGHRRRQLHQRAKDGVGTYARDQIMNVNLGRELGDGRPELEDQRLHQRLLRELLRLLRARHRLVAGRLVLRGFRDRRLQRRLVPELRLGQPFRRLVHRPERAAGVDRLDRHRLALLGRRHVRRRVRRRPPALAEQPATGRTRPKTAPSRARASPLSTRPTACRSRGTRDAIPAVMAPR